MNPATPLAAEAPSYGLSFWRFAALLSRSLSPQAILSFVVVLGGTGFWIFAVTTNPEKITESTVSAGLMAGIGLLNLALMLGAFYGIYVHPYRTMEQAGPLRLNVRDNAVTLCGPESRREYAWDRVIIDKVGSSVRLRAGRQWTPDFVPVGLLDLGEAKQRAEAARSGSKRAQVKIGGDYELRLTTRDHLREWVRASTSPRGTMVLAAFSTLSALSLWLAVTMEGAWICLGFGLLAGVTTWFVQPALAPLIVRASPIRQCVADLTPEGLRYQQDGYVETIPWKSIRLVRLGGDRVTVYHGQCGFLMRARKGAADPRAVIPATVKTAQGTNRGFKSAALTLAASGIFATSTAFIVTAAIVPSLITDSYYEQYRYGWATDNFTKAILLGAAWAVILFGLMAFTSMLTKRRTV